MAVESQRSVDLRGATGAVRTVIHEGKEHLVVPVIALMDTVIHAINANSPENVPLATLKKAAQSWNGRPVVLGHPVRNGTQVSANDPEVLAAHGLGTIFNSHVEGNKLLMEAWLDTEKTAKIAGTAFLESARAAKPGEVSVGAFVVTDGNKPGVHANGRRYMSSWIEATGDHLAMLHNGVGACSMKDGCGSHRAAESPLMHLVTAEGIELETLETKPLDKAFPPKVYPFVVHEQGNTPKSYHKTSGEAGRHARIKAKVTGKSHRVVVRATGATHFKTAEEKTSMAVETNPVEKKSLREKVMELLRGAQAETPAELASEEAAELVQYQTIESLLEQCGKSYDEAHSIVQELIADESETPTETPEEEAAEEEIESARLEAISAHCVQMIGSLSGIMSITRALLADEKDEQYGSMMTMAAQARTLVGKRHSMTDQAMVQAVHDHSVNLGADCPAMAEEYKAAAAAKELRAASCKCGNDAAGGEIDMEKTEQIKLLMANAHNSIKDEKVLGAMTDAQLTALAASCADVEKTTAALKAAQEANDKQTADLAKQAADLKAANASVEALKTAAAQPKTKEQWLAEAPTEFGAIYTRYVTAEAQHRTDLVGKLKTAAAGVYTEEALNAMPTEQLEATAKLLKLDAPVVTDFSGRGVARAASAVNEQRVPPPADMNSMIRAAQGKQ